MAPLRPSWASLMTSRTPARPRARRLRRKAVQKAPSSLSPTARPRTSRSPLRVTPVAMTIALDTTLAPSWALTYVASRKTYGKAM